MKNLLKKMAKKIAAFIRALGGSGNAPGGAPGQPQSPAALIEAAPDTADADEIAEEQKLLPSPSPTVSPSSDIKPTLENYQMAKQVQLYNAAFQSMDFNARIEAGDRMTPAVRAWVSRLSDNDRAILQNCSAFDIGNHLSGVVPIEGIAAVGQAAVYDTRPVKFGQRISDELVADRKPSAEVIDFTSRRTAEQSRAPNVDMFVNDGKPLSKYEQRMLEQMERQNAFAEERAERRQAMSSGKAPTPPASMFPQRGTLH